MTDDGTPDGRESELGGELGGERQLSSIGLPEEHPAIAPLSFLLGRWKGTGKGGYPTIEDFDFAQEVSFTHVGKPYLIYASRTWRLSTGADGKLVRGADGQLTRGQPLAMETGFWRPQPDSRVEVVLAHPTGITEIYHGEVRGTRIDLATDVVARTETAKPVTAGTRLYGLVPSEVREGEKDLAYAYDMAAMGLPLTPHLSAVLHWDWVE